MGFNQKSTIDQVSYSPASQFRIPNSAFRLPNSAFPIPHSEFKTHPPGPLPFEEEKGEFFRIQLAFFLLPSSKNENYSTFIF